MKEIDIVLKSLSDGLKAIAKSMESVAKQVDALTTSKPKPKTARKAPVRKKAPARKKTATRKPAAKTAAPKRKVVKKAPAKKRVTAVDTILTMISRSKKGISVASLRTKTNFNDKKIANIVYKLKKQGKIKSASKGLYVKA